MTLKVKLIELNAPLTPEGFMFTEKAALDGLKTTLFPVRSNQRQKDLFEQETGPEVIEFQCTSMAVEDGWLVGEVEFNVPASRPATRPDEYRFFARVMPNGGSRDMSVNNQTRSFVDFHYSSVGFREKV